MVFKRYIKKNGKLFGPYYYESYRDGGKVKHRFLGTKNPNKKIVTLQVLIISAFFLTIFFLFSFNGMLTGFAILEDTTNWEKDFGGGASYGITVSSDSFVYVTGNIAEGDWDWLVKKYYTNGTEVLDGWNKTINISRSSDLSWVIKEDSLGNIYVSGRGTNLVTGTSGTDWHIKRFNSSGTENISAWNLSFNSYSTSSDDITDMEIDSTDNVYVAGYGTRVAPGSTNQDGWVKKFHSNGSEVANWEDGLDIGNIGSEISYDVAISPVDDSVYVTGRYLKGSWRDITRKFYSNGSEDDVNWNKTSGISSVGYSLAVDSAGNVYYGHTIPTNSGDWWIQKYYSNGTEIVNGWNKTFDGGGGADNPFSITIDSLDNVYILGEGTDLNGSESDSDTWIKKFNSAGTEDTADWNRNYSSSGSFVRGVINGTDLYIAGAGLRKFYVGDPAIVVTISSPVVNTYVNSPTIPIEVKINNSGICNYTLDLGVTNTTLTANASATGFTLSRTFSNGAYSFYAYCVDDNGQKNYTTSVNFSVSYTAPVEEETVGSPPASQTGGGTDVTAPIESSCEEIWICSLWGDCANGISTRECEDLAECGTSVDKPAETQSCSVQECTSNFLCGEWSSCNYVGDIGDILSGEIGSGGSRTRTCGDSNNCLSSYVETSECEVELSDDGGGDSSTQEFEIEIETLPSGESSLVTRSSATGKPTSRINLDALKKGRLEVSFVQDEDNYPKHCFNAVLDGDELEIDCGGSCEYCGLNSKKYSLFPWIMFGLLISTLAGGMSLHSLEKGRRRKIENWLEEGEKSLNTAELTGSHDDLKDAVEYYNLIKKNFSKLGIGNRGLLRDDVEIYRKRLNKQIGRFNQPAHSDIKEKREERFKKFYEKRK